MFCRRGKEGVRGDGYTRRQHHDTLQCSMSFSITGATQWVPSSTSTQQGPAGCTGGLWRGGGLSGLRCKKVLRPMGASPEKGWGKWREGEGLSTEARTPLLEGHVKGVVTSRPTGARFAAHPRPSRASFRLRVTGSTARATGLSGQQEASTNLRDGAHDEGVHAHLGVVRLLLAEPGVHHVVDAIDRQRRLGDVCSHHHLHIVQTSARTSRPWTRPHPAATLVSATSNGKPSFSTAFPATTDRILVSLPPSLPPAENVHPRAEWSRLLHVFHRASSA